MTYHRIIRQECGDEVCPLADRATTDLNRILDDIETMRATCESLRSALAERMALVDELTKERDASIARAERAEQDRDGYRDEVSALAKQIADAEEADRRARIYGATT